MTSPNIDVTLDCRANIEAQTEIELKNEEGKIFDVRYKLVRLECPDSVFIAVSECDGEVDALCVGSDQQRAEYIFSLICEHGVMPGFLSDTFSGACI